MLRLPAANILDINDKDIPAIRAQLRKDIDGLILNKLNVGLDLEHPGPQHARRSLNHTALLYRLSGGYQVRLDMQNYYETKLGQTAPGIWAIKFTPYQGASDSKSTMITELFFFTSCLTSVYNLSVMTAMVYRKWHSNTTGAHRNFGTFRNTKAVVIMRRFISRSLHFSQVTRMQQGYPSTTN